MECSYSQAVAYDLIALSFIWFVLRIKHIKLKYLPAVVINWILMCHAGS